MFEEKCFQVITGWIFFEWWRCLKEWCWKSCYFQIFWTVQKKSLPIETSWRCVYFFSLNSPSIIKFIYNFTPTCLRYRSDLTLYESIFDGYKVMHPKLISQKLSFLRIDKSYLYYCSVLSGCKSTIANDVHGNLPSHCHEWPHKNCVLNLTIQK